MGPDRLQRKPDRLFADFPRLPHCYLRNVEEKQSLPFTVSGRSQEGEARGCDGHGESVERGCPARLSGNKDRKTPVRRTAVPDVHPGLQMWCASMAAGRRGRQLAWDLVDSGLTNLHRDDEETPLAKYQVHSSGEQCAWSHRTLKSNNGRKLKPGAKGDLEIL